MVTATAPCPGQPSLIVSGSKDGSVRLLPLPATLCAVLHPLVGGAVSEIPCQIVCHLSSEVSFSCEPAFKHARSTLYPSMVLCKQALLWDMRAPQAPAGCFATPPAAGTQAANMLTSLDASETMLLAGGTNKTVTQWDFRCARGDAR